MDDIQKLYHAVFRVAKHFLDQSKRFTIAELKQHDEPTYEEVAQLARELAALIGALAATGGWDEERVALNARQAATHMEQMAIAIVLQDSEKLASAASSLEKMDFI